MNRIKTQLKHLLMDIRELCSGVSPLQFAHDLLEAEADILEKEGRSQQAPLLRVAAERLGKQHPEPLEKKLDEIVAYCLMHFGHQGALKIGIWDDQGESFYATIGDDQDLHIYGESSYGSFSIEEALDYLLNELHEMNKQEVE